jgi:hypothetical protein
MYSRGSATTQDPYEMLLLVQQVCSGCPSPILTYHCTPA